MGQTAIEWTDLSFNPIRARRTDGKNRVAGHFCQKISLGCANCYSSNFQPRFYMPTFGGVNKTAADNGVEVYLDEELLTSLLKRKKPAKVFWCDMSDLFGEWVPFEWIDQCFAVMALAPHLTHQILTKRPERMAEYLTWRSGSHELDADRRYVVWSTCRLLIEAAVKTGTIRRLFATPDETKLFLKEFEWPLPNVWLGCSVENQDAADRRIPELLKTPAAVRFLSVEPLLGPVDFFNADRDGLRGGMRGAIHWIIVGGESGPNARPCDVEWIRNIVRQCKEAGVPCFVKQLGSRPTVDLAGSNDGFGEGTVAIPDGLVGTGDDVVLRGKVALRDRKGGDMAEFPEDLRVREFPRSFSHG